MLQTGGLEPGAEMTARIAHAARHMPVDRRAISPQCGFATSIGGNALTIDEQSAKLAVVCETAERVWG